MTAKKATTPTIDTDIPVSAPTPKGHSMNTNTLAEERSRTPVHETRAYETWTDEAVHAIEDAPWVPPTSLEAPPPRAGFVQRWIRVGMFGVDDPTNTARKTREGWRPRSADSVPKGFHLPTISHGQWAGCIGVEGSLLCEMPVQLADKKKAALKDKTDGITEALPTELQKHSHSSMPITQERSSRVVREVKAADD